MTLKEIANIRLNSQQIASTTFNNPTAMVSWMCAMQAQDYAMARWAVGTRLPGSTDQSILSAIDRGEIIRTHVLRPTWHLVSADDIYWMLELTAPQIKAFAKTMHRELELSELLFKRSNTLIKKAMSGGNHLTRDELSALFKKAKIATNDNRLSHLMLRAELDGIVCSGATKNNKQTYALLGERVPQKKMPTREKALEKLAGKYFSSHCPATLQDFVWWSGLPVTDARNALDMIKKSLVKTTVAAQTYWMKDDLIKIKQHNSSVYLLPAFDEFIISYKDRTASLPLQHHGKAVSNNGLFRPVIVINGKVTGLWKRTIKKDTVIVETECFQPYSLAAKKRIRKAAEQLGYFLNKKAEVVYVE